MSGCCDEPRCRRSQPIHLSYSELTGNWYFVTRWKQRKGKPDGYFEAIEKHRMPEHIAKQLTAWRNNDTQCQHSRTWVDDGVRYCEDCGYAC